MNEISTLDTLITGIYLIGIIALGLWYGRRKNKTSEGYFLADKSLTWGVIGASLFASNISTVHLVGLSESGYIDGIVWGNFEWFSAFELLILAFLFIPFYIKTKIATLPEFLEKRYDWRSRMVLAIFSILAALFMHIGVSFYAGAIVFEKIFGVDIFISIIIIAVATGIYTIIGGLASVVITESIQTLLLILGASVITVLAVLKLPDLGIHTFGEFKEAADPDRLRAVAFDTELKGFTFLDMLFGHLVLGIWYWCTDQTIVQRVLGARNETQAKLGAVFAGFLKILPVFIMVVPGILAFVLFREEIGENTKSVFPVMIMNLLPVGLKGLMIAAILAAVMSSVAAALNSCSTLVAYDIFGRMRPDMPDRKKIFIGRVTGGLVLILAVMWSPFLGNLGGIFELINQMFSIFAPSIVTVFLWGVLSKKGTAHAAFWTLTLGSGLALMVFIVEKYIPINGIIHFISSPDGFGLNWLRQTYIFFIISSIIYGVISWKDHTPQILPTDFYLHIKKPDRRVQMLSILLVLVMITLYLIFY